MKSWLVVFLTLLLISFSFGSPLTHGNIYLFAVSDDGKGIAANLELSLVEGNGHVWSKITSLIGVSTQNTERTVVQLSRNYVDYVDKYDYKYEIISDAKIVDGPSAGLPMALLTVTMLKGEKIPDYISATGTISSQGLIGSVGAIVEKTKIAHKHGIKLFFVPKSNLEVIVKDKGIKKVNLSKYAYEKYGMKVIGVDTLDEALDYLKKPLSDIVIETKEPEIIIYNPPPTTYKENLSGFASFVDSYFGEVKANIEAAKNIMNNTLLDQDVTNTLLEFIVYADKLLEEGSAAKDGNYLYSAANYFFLSNIYTNLVLDICNNPSLLNLNGEEFNQNLSLLKLNLATLKKKLDYLPYNDFEWFVAARERFLWAEFYVSQLANITIVLNDQVKDAALAKLEKYEYAKEWVKVAEGFLKNVDNNSKIGVSVEDYKDSAYTTLQEIKKAEAAINKYDLTDLDRRIYGAKEAYNNGWYLTSLYESATVLGIVNANITLEDKTYPELESIVKDKIVDLESKMVDTNFQYVWSELYLNHAKYFLSEAKFYKSKNNISYALNSLGSSLELVYLADNLYSASKNFYDNRDNLTHFTIAVSYEDLNLPAASIITTTTRHLGLLTIIGIIVALFIVSIIVAYISAMLLKKRSENVVFAETNKEIKKVKNYLLELDKSYLNGKIKDEEYSTLRKEYNARLIALEKKRKQIVENLEDLAYLESQLKYLHNKLSKTISFYTKGLISEEEYNRLVTDYKNEITNIKYNIEEDKKKLEDLRKKEINNQQKPKKESKKGNSEPKALKQKKKNTKNKNKK